MDSNYCSASATKAESTNSGNTAGSSSSVMSEEAEEAQDEESSSSSSSDSEMVSELDAFRRKWKREIEVSPSKDGESGGGSSGGGGGGGGGGTSSGQQSDISQKTEEQARSLFLCGVQAERAGLLEKAISYYRRAVQLVPDIEFRISDNSNDQTSNSFSDDSEDYSDKENIPYSDASEPETTDLVEKFQKVAFIQGCTSICQPNIEPKGTHISALPPEIFIYILKWVVSSDLDLLSLEQVSKVCRGFYVCARDPEIWRLACLRIWELNLGSPNKYGSWRSMYIQRPRLSYYGAYISKTTYIRYGEQSFQDSSYRPCYLVAYFRYLRFFPEGLVLMLTTPDDPYQSLFKLRYRKSKYQSIMFGRYKLIGSTVMAVVKKPKVENSNINYYRYRRGKQVNSQEACDQTFHMELELRNVKNRFNCQLVWKHYSIHMVYRNGQEAVSEFDLTPSNFPPFWFSRVKSYTAESESPLM